MNDQLRNELDQRSKIVEKEREKTQTTLRELKSANAQRFDLQQQLDRRENQIKGTLNRIEVKLGLKRVLDFSEPNTRRRDNICSKKKLTYVPYF